VIYPPLLPVVLPPLLVGVVPPLLLLGAGELAPLERCVALLPELVDLDEELVEDELERVVVPLSEEVLLELAVTVFDEEVKPLPSLTVLELIFPAVGEGLTPLSTKFVFPSERATTPVFCKLIPFFPLFVYDLPTVEREPETVFRGPFTTLKEPL
jgi:hypothetical protein